MSISRKEFFRQGFFSLGKTVLDVAENLQGSRLIDKLSCYAAEQNRESDLSLVAESFNERCLARNCGCFACSERCASMAIMVVPGEGVRIDRMRCTGCGNCEYVCPVEPKAIILAPRKTS